MTRRPKLVITLLVAFSGGVVFGEAAADRRSGSKADGWRELFNGKDFTGWQNASGGIPRAGWAVEDGALVRRGRAGDIWTAERFGDFMLDLEFKTEGNSGIFFRTDNPRDCVQTGIEMQVYPPVDRPSRNSCGAIYNCVAPAKEMTKRGQWNRVTIIAVDNRIAVILNGEQIVDMDLNRWTEPHKNPDGSKNKFAAALKDFKREGHIGFQDHGAAVSFRNVRIKPLDKSILDKTITIKLLDKPE